MHKYRTDENEVRTSFKKAQFWYCLFTAEIMSLVISFIQTKLAILKWTSGATNHKIK